MLTCAAARAQGTPAPAPDDPVVATVDGKPIHLSDLKDAVQLLPENMRSLPPQAMYPMLLDQMIDARALVSEARKSGLDKDPAVQRKVAAAEDRAGGQASQIFEHVYADPPTRLRQQRRALAGGEDQE